MKHALLTGILIAAAAVSADEPTPQQVIAAAARKVVKVYGAGGLRGLEAYQSGLLVSPTGEILTAASTVLDCEAIACILDDGRRFTARLVGVDARRELALLHIEGTGLPSFSLPAESGAVTPGRRVVALSNMFGVAAGDERVTAQRGVVAAVVPLEARRGVAEAPFRGDVYVLDFTTNNPGSAGGGLIDARGRLVGMLGKELRSTATGIWLNYAIPAAELVAGREAILAGTAAAAEAPPSEPFDPRPLGVILVPDLLDRTPPFVETVEPGTAAEAAGLQPDDLLIAVGSRSVSTRAEVERALGGLAAGDPVWLTIIRDGKLVEVELGPRPAGGGP